MDGGTIESVIERMGTLLEPMEAAADPRRHFLATYRRTTIAVHKALLVDNFLDAAWVERWDVVFASLYLDALEQWNCGEAPPGPWAVAFGSATDRRVPPLRHVLLGMNAHINYDLPQALLAAITDDEFVDRAVVARRNADHERIDAILSSRVDAEDLELQRVEGPGDRTRLDRMLKPFNQAATKRFMKESRRKVWRNALALSIARRGGPAMLRARLVELEGLSRWRVEDLRVPGQVLIKLAARGFGVELPRSEADDPVGLFDQPGDVGWRHPDSTDGGEVVVGCPTGNRATLSNVDRHRTVERLGDEVTKRRHAKPSDALTSIGFHQLGGVAGEDDARRLAGLDGAVHGEVPRNRSPRGIRWTA